MTARRVLFQIHWFLGITAGLVLALIGITGAVMSFEDEIMAALSPGIVTLAPSDAAPLAPDALIAAASAQRGGARVARLVMERDPLRAGEVNFVPPKGERRGERSYIDPRTGELLGRAAGADAFRFVQDLHRWLALPGAGNGWGRQITGFAALALIFFAASGLYLRWPRRALDWRSWLVLDLGMTGRNLYRALHATVGGWLFVVYLLTAFTGLWWSYEWYRNGVQTLLIGKPPMAEGRRGGEEPSGPAPSLDRAWAAFLEKEGSRFERVTITTPRGGGPAVMRMMPAGARFEQMTDELRFDTVDGRLVGAALYADKTVGQTIVTGVLALHTGAFFGLPGRILLFVASLAMPLFTVTGLLLYFGRRRAKRALAAAKAAEPAAGGGAGPLIVHASQTGAAERLARLSAAALGGAPVKPLASVLPADLRSAGRVLFVASTYGEGEAPDIARRFETSVMKQPADLAGVDYAVLALGDREYADFCGFGRRLDGWLQASGGRRLFDTIEIDGDDEAAERAWRRRLADVGGAADIAWARDDYEPWTLSQRRWLNPGSPGAPVYSVLLEPPGAADWAPGAIAEILPRHDPARVDRVLAANGRAGDAALREALMGSVLPEDGSFRDNIALRPLAHREYSIASIASSGRIELLVRQCRSSDGGFGIGSGWLTAVAGVGDVVRLRVRPNAGFSAPADIATPLVLIGNGTGLAGLMAHLRARAGLRGGDVWLIYGERSPEHDRPLAAELEALSLDGTLTRIDRAFSRDPAQGRYVQDVVASQAEDVREWAGRGAGFYVCGSLDGMAPAVDWALRDIIGADEIDALRTAGRYRRDVY